MAKLHNVVTMLNNERRKLEGQAQGITQAIAALTNHRGGSKRNRLSFAARQRIAQAQRERWAKVRAEKEPKKAKSAAWTPARRRAYSLRMKRQQKKLQRARGLVA